MVSMALEGMERVMQVLIIACTFCVNNSCQDSEFDGWVGSLYLNCDRCM